MQVIRYKIDSSGFIKRKKGAQLTCAPFFTNPKFQPDQMLFSNFISKNNSGKRVLKI